MFYETFSNLCEKRNVSMRRVMIDLGLTCSAPAKWKKGTTPSGATLTKLANYFDVPLDSLIEHSESAVKCDSVDSDADIALFNGYRKLTQEQKDVVRQVIEQMRKK